MNGKAQRGRKWRPRCKADLIHWLCFPFQAGERGKLRFLPFGAEDIIDHQSEFIVALRIVDHCVGDEVAGGREAIVLVGRSVSQVAANARSMIMSRKPPRASLRSGSSR